MGKEVGFTDNACRVSPECDGTERRTYEEEEHGSLGCGLSRRLYPERRSISLCRSINLASDRMNVPTHLRACPDESMPGDQSISSPWVDLLGLNSLGSSCFIWISFATGLMKTWEES